VSASVRFPTLEELRGLSLFSYLGANDRAFLERIFATPPGRYLGRLRDVGLVGLRRVVDLGCGFGQWSLCLAATNQEVIAVEPQPIRLAVLEKIAELVEAEGLVLRPGRGETLPVESAEVDGILCFGVLQYADPDVLFAECARVLRPGGIGYVLGKDIGGYLFDWCEAPNATEDFNPRQCAADAFANTLSLETRGVPASGLRWGDRIVSQVRAEEAARGAGLLVHGAGPEGSVRLEGTRPDAPEGGRFFQTAYRGFPSSYELVVRKPWPR